MLIRNRRSAQQGGLMLSAVLFLGIVGTILAIYQTVETQRQREQLIERQGRYMADYLSALAGFMAEQGQTAPNASSISGLSSIGGGQFEATGTDWLKDNTCGGGFSPDESHLGCSLPTNFNEFFGLGAPTVTFDYTNQPEATVTFGQVQDNGNDPITAGKLVRTMNASIEAAGYQHIDVFHISDPNNADVLDANLRATIDSQVASDIYVRRDGTGEMTGPLLSEHDNWALIARDDAGNENSAEQDPNSSVNVNDGYVRSVDAWMSETHKLAEEAFNRAARAPQFMTQVPSDTDIDKPSCPGTLQEKIFTSPVVFIGGSGSNNRLISGVKTFVLDNTGSWNVRMQIEWDGSGSFQEPPASRGQIKVVTKCG